MPQIDPSVPQPIVQSRRRPLLGGPNFTLRDRGVNTRLAGAFNQEKALVGAFSVIVQSVVEPMDRFTALVSTSTMPGSVRISARIQTESDYK